MTISNDMCCREAGINQEESLLQFQELGAPLLQSPSYPMRAILSGIMEITGQ